MNGSGEIFIDGKPMGCADNVTLSIERLNDSLERFNSALAAAASEWPDEVIEDVLDAEYIG